MGHNITCIVYGKCSFFYSVWYIFCMPCAFGLGSFVRVALFGYRNSFQTNISVFGFLEVLGGYMRNRQAFLEWKKQRQEKK